MSVVPYSDEFFHRLYSDITGFQIDRIVHLNSEEYKQAEMLEMSYEKFREYKTKTMLQALAEANTEAYNEQYGSKDKREKIVFTGK